MPLIPLLVSLALGAGEFGPTHPHVDAVHRFRAAMNAGDHAAATALLAADSRIWFGEKIGEGQRRSIDGGGPWAAWDEVFRSRSAVRDVKVDGSMVRTRVEEMNDWYRLIERAPSVYFVSYWFDEDGRIAETLIHADPDAPEGEDRLADFRAWADAKHPGAVEALMPQGEIVPSRANAERWTELLLEWRASSGLLDPRDGC